MSGDSTESQRALRPMRERLVSVPDAAVLEARRARVLPAICAAVRDVPARRAHARRQRLLIGLAAAAAAVLVAAGAPGLVRGKLTVAGESEPARLSALAGAVEHRDVEGVRRVAPGETLGVLRSGEVQTGAGSRARVESGGTRIELDEKSLLRVAELGSEPGMRSRVELRSGSIRCTVSPRTGAGRFSVVTPDAVVTVHGTVFSVSLGGPHTCVRVESGVVTVEHAGALERVAGGGSWGCAPERAHALSTASGSPSASAVSRSIPGRPCVRSGATGTLAEENRLFEAALAAERRGEAEIAIATLGELLTRFPNSPLAGEARAARTRLRRR